jgi:uncharacterized membrane protein
MNDDGEMVGFVEEAGRARPFHAVGEAMGMLDMPRFAIDAKAVAINGKRQIVGSCSMWVSGEPYRFACFWSSRGSEVGFGKMVVLPTPESATESAAFDLNDDGVIVGYFRDENQLSHACQ